MYLQLQNKINLVMGSATTSGDRIVNVLADEGDIPVVTDQQVGDQRVAGVTEEFRKAVIAVLG